MVGDKAKEERKKVDKKDNSVTLYCLYGKTPCVILVSPHWFTATQPTSATFPLYYPTILSHQARNHRGHPLKGPLSRKYFPLNKKYYVFCRGRSNTRRSAPILPLCPHPHFLCSLVRKSFLIYTGHPSGFQILPVLRTRVSSRETQKIIGSMPCPNVCISTYGYKPTLDKLMA